MTQWPNASATAMMSMIAAALRTASAITGSTAPQPDAAVDEEREHDRHHGRQRRRFGQRDDAAVESAQHDHRHQKAPESRTRSGAASRATGIDVRHAHSRAAAVPEDVGWRAARPASGRAPRRPGTGAGSKCPRARHRPRRRAMAGSGCRACPRRRRCPRRSRAHSRRAASPAPGSCPWRWRSQPTSRTWPRRWCRRPPRPGPGRRAACPTQPAAASIRARATPPRSMKVAAMTK